MTEDTKNGSPSADVARSDELAARLAAIESRLDQMDTRFNSLNIPAILQQQELVNRRHGELLLEFKKEQESLRQQTGSMSADRYEAWQPIGTFVSILVVIGVVVVFWPSIVGFFSLIAR